MVATALFILTLLFTIGHLTYKKEWSGPKSAEVFLGYLLLFCVGIMSILASYGHIFMGPEVARKIGWQPGSPFQFEMGMTNLSYGILGVLAFWIRGRFWDATIIGWSILLLGCFVGHAMDYVAYHNDAPWNFGIQIWLYDLILPIIALLTLVYLRTRTES